MTDVHTKLQLLSSKSKECSCYKYSKYILCPHIHAHAYIHMHSYYTYCKTEKCKATQKRTPFLYFCLISFHSAENMSLCSPGWP